MRIAEAQQLRVKDLDFAHAALIVRCGKGGKDRVLMLPQSLVPALCEVQLNLAYRCFCRLQRKPVAASA